jgi:hypothetical protein
MAMAHMIDYTASAEGGLRLPNGKVFLLRSVTDAPTDDDDFADEVVRTRQNVALMELFRERSHEFNILKGRQRWRHRKNVRLHPKTL